MNPTWRDIYICILLQFDIVLGSSDSMRAKANDLTGSSRKRSTRTTNTYDDFMAKKSTKGMRYVFDLIIVVCLYFCHATPYGLRNIKSALFRNRYKYKKKRS